MLHSAVIHRCGSLLFGLGPQQAPAARQRASRRVIRVEFLEPRALMSTTQLPIEFTLPADVSTNDFYVSITAQLDADYTTKPDATHPSGQLLTKGTWVYFDPSKSDYAKADGTTPTADLTFKLTGFVDNKATVEIPYTKVVSGHIVMGVGSAPYVAYANNPKTNEGGISAPTPGGQNYDKIYGLFEYALAADPLDASKLLVDVDLSEVDQVGFPFTITTEPDASAPGDLGVGITQTRTDLFNLYQQYITDKGIGASSFKQLVQSDATGKIRIMAPNNYVEFAPDPIPIQKPPTLVAGGELTKDTWYYYWVTATNGYGETTTTNFQNALTSDGSSGGMPIHRQTVQLSWEASAGATGYNIYRWPPNVGTQAIPQPGKPEFLGKWDGKSTDPTTHLPIYVDQGKVTPTSKTFPTTNYTFFPQNRYFNDVIQQFFNHYTTPTKPASFSIDVPLSKSIGGKDETAFYSLSGRVVTDYEAQAYNGQNYKYTALVLTGDTSKANIQKGFPSMAGQKFVVFRPYFSDNVSAVFPPAPKVVSNQTHGPGVMVFGNDGVFNTGDTSDFGKILSTLQNKVVSAFNRGIATNYNVAPNNWANAPDVVSATTLPGGSLKKDAYYYVVTADNAAGETTASLEFGGIIASDPNPAEPHNHNSISLQWKAADPSVVHQYNIYRSTTPGSGYQLIASVDNKQPGKPTDPRTIFVDPGTLNPNPAKTPELYYAPGTTSNWYAGFFHQNSTNNPTTGVSIRGLAYGFAYDDQGGNSTNLEDDFTKIKIKLQPWAASQAPPVRFDPTPNAPVDIQILMQPKSSRAGSFTTISFKAFGPQGQSFTGGTQVTVDVVGMQKGSYVVNVNPINGFGILTFKSTEVGYNYLKITQGDGKIYKSQIYNTLATSIPLSMLYIFDQESQRLSKISSFYNSLDAIARSRG